MTKLLRKKGIQACSVSSAHHPEELLGKKSGFLVVSGTPSGKNHLFLRNLGIGAIYLIPDLSTLLFHWIVN
jgi:hypothetical protein